MRRIFILVMAFISMIFVMFIIAECPEVIAVGLY
jgi:hypothetical protein